MRRMRLATIAVVIAALASSIRIASAQSQSESAAAAQTTAADSAKQDQAEWARLPFKNLAEFENLIPVGMTRGDLSERLAGP